MESAPFDVVGTKFVPEYDVPDDEAVIGTGEGAFTSNLRTGVERGHLRETRHLVAEEGERLANQEKESRFKQKHQRELAAIRTRRDARPIAEYTPDLSNEDFARHMAAARKKAT